MIRKLLHKIFGNKKKVTSKPAQITDIVKLDFTDFKVVFDIGAYHGGFTDDVLTKTLDLKIHQFEPNIEAFDFLTKKYNGNNIVINNNAISNKIGIENLYLNSYDETNSLLASNSIDESIDRLTKNISSQQINVVTLDSYCQHHNIHFVDFVKIDTQGNSYNVLLGAEKLLKEKKIKYLYVEAEFIEIYKNQKCFSDIELLMKEYGYQVVNIFNLNYTDNGRLAWCDCLFTMK